MSFFYLYNLFKNFTRSIVSFIKVLFASKYSVGIKKLRAENAECYILGNGPSLKEYIAQNITHLSSKTLLVVNDFARSEHFLTLKPQYYVIADPAYWNTAVYEGYYSSCSHTLKMISDITTWPMYLIMPNEAFKNKDVIKVLSQNKNIKLLSYNKTSISGFDVLNKFFYKNYLGMPPVQNVLCACVFIAINMKFPVINILGADHSWTKNLVVNDKNEVCHRWSYFYSEKTIAEETIFLNMYGQPYKMHDILRDYAQMFESHHMLRKYADYSNVAIVNLTPDSYIDAYDRLSK